MTAVDVKIAVDAHVINMQDEKFTKDAHFYVAGKELKVGAKDVGVTTISKKQDVFPTTLGTSTATPLIVPESQASDDQLLGGNSTAATPPPTLQGALSNVGSKTKPTATPTIVPESQASDDPLMGGNSTAPTPPPTLQGALSNVGSKTKPTNIIVPQSPAQSTADPSMQIQSTVYPSGSKLKELLAEKIKKAEKEIQSLQQAVMNAQKPRSHNLNLTFIKNKALNERIIGKEIEPAATITEQDGPDCGRGTYRQQDTKKRDNYIYALHRSKAVT